MIYVTGNDKKFEEAKIILKDFNLEQKDIDIPEIQGTGSEILKEKALRAWDVLKRPFIIEDVCFETEALGGMPGPYIKDFLFALADKNMTLHDVVSPLGKTRAKAICNVAYVKNPDDIFFVSGIAKGEVVSPKGNLDHGKVSFNKIFKPDGCEMTYGEMTMEEHAQYSSRSDALRKLEKEFYQNS